MDTFEYRSDLKGTEITLLNSKTEIQVALEEMSKVFEERSGVHVEVMPVTDGDSPYTKVVSLYNSGNPPTLSILDTTDVVALAGLQADAQYQINGEATVYTGSALMAGGILLPQAEGDDVSFLFDVKKIGGHNEKI